MTIEKEEPGIWIVCCDKCGERVELDTDPDDEFQFAVDEVKTLGWKICPPETVKFPGEFEWKKTHRVTYWTHLCGDCR